MNFNQLTKMLSQDNQDNQLLNDINNTTITTTTGTDDNHHYPTYNVIKRSDITTYQERKNPKVPTNMQIDGYVYAYKDALNSSKNGNRYVLKCCQRKICSAYIHIPEKFDFDRLQNTREEPSMHLLNVRSNYDIDIIDNYTVFGFNMPHKCSKVGLNVAKVEITEADFDVAYFTGLAKLHHWKGPDYIKTQARQDGKFFGKNQVEKFLIAYRKLNAPSEELAQFNPQYGKTLDEPEDKRQLFFQARGDVVDHTRGKSLRYVILSAKFSLGILCKSKKWYIDSTYRCSPKPFKQVIIFIGKYQTQNYPCVYILIDSKKKVAYHAAFTELKIIIDSYNLVLEKDITVNTDFEEGISDTIKTIFELKTEGSFYQYVKSLWANAKKVGLLRTPNYFENIKLMILYLIIFTNVDLDMRDTYYQALYYMFKEKGQEFIDFLLFFKKNLLDHYFLKFPRVNRDQQPEKVYDISESFTAAFNKSIGIFKPELKVFMERLKQIEYDYRKGILERFEQGMLSIYSDPNEIILPFTEIFSLIEKNKDSILKYQHQPPTDQKTELMEKLKKLVDSCYVFIYGEKPGALLYSYRNEGAHSIKLEDSDDEMQRINRNNRNQIGNRNNNKNVSNSISNNNVKNLGQSQNQQSQNYLFNSNSDNSNNNIQQNKAKPIIIIDNQVNKTDQMLNSKSNENKMYGYNNDTSRNNHEKADKMLTKENQEKLLEAVMEDDDEDDIYLDIEEGSDYQDINLM